MSVKRVILVTVGPFAIAIVDRHIALLRLPTVAQLAGTDKAHHPVQSARRLAPPRVSF